MKGRALGVGATYAPEMEELFDPRHGLVDVVEVEPQTTWIEVEDEDAPYRIDAAVLERLRALPQRKIVHGVGFPIGGSRPPDPRHLAPFAETIRALDAPWASEHLSFNKVFGPKGSFSTGFLLPPLQTPEGVSAAVASIRATAAALPVPFAIETGVNYLRPRDGELSDGDFVAAIAEAAGCGILLDLHNLWTNERNGRQSIDEFLGAIPLERVWEVHFAGGFERGGLWLDAHSGASPREVLEVARSVIPALPNLRALIFEILPEYIPSVGLSRVRAELEDLRALWELRRCTPPRAIPRRPAAAPARAGLAEVSPAEWELALGTLVIGADADTALGRELRADPGVLALRDLSAEARAGTIVGALKLTSRLLIARRGAPALRALLHDFWETRPPAHFAAAEALAFGGHLKRIALDEPHLDEILSFELALLRSLTAGERSVVRFSREPMALIEAVFEGRATGSAPAGAYQIAVDAGGELEISALPS